MVVILIINITPAACHNYFLQQIFVNLRQINSVTPILTLYNTDNNSGWHNFQYVHNSLSTLPTSVS